MAAIKNKRIQGCEETKKNPEEHYQTEDQRFQRQNFHQKKKSTISGTFGGDSVNHPMSLRKHYTKSAQNYLNRNQSSPTKF